MPGWRGPAMPSLTDAAGLFVPCRPPKEFFDEVMAALRLSLRPPPPLRVRPGFVSGGAAQQRFMAPSSHVRHHRLGTGGSSQLMGGSDGMVVPSRRSSGPVAPSTALPVGACPAVADHDSRQRLTLNQEQFIATVPDVDVDVALADLRAVRTSDATKAANSAAYPLYRLVCEKLRVLPWPPTTDTLEAFAAYLRFSGAYKAPQAYWWAIIHHARDMGDFCAFDKARADGMVARLERDMPEHEQAAPLTVPVL